VVALGERSLLVAQLAWIRVACTTIVVNDACTEPSASRLG
jgi:hypothetical protein